MIENVFPTIINHIKIKKIRSKINSSAGLDCPSNEIDINKLLLSDLEKLYESDLKIKDKLEDKAKANIIGVTIAVTLIMGAYTLVQSIYAKSGSMYLIWLSFVLFVLSVIFMLEAGMHAIHVLTAENIVYNPSISAPYESKKSDINLQIGLNRAQNLIRNNYIYTSYICMRNSLICLFLVMIFAIFPIKGGSHCNYTHGNFFFSEQAMTYMDNESERNKVEDFINNNLENGDYSIVDFEDYYYLKYNVEDGTVRVILVEPIDR